MHTKLKLRKEFCLSFFEFGHLFLPTFYVIPFFSLWNEIVEPPDDVLNPFYVW